MAAAISSQIAQSAAAVTPMTAVLNGGPFANASLYVGDLEGSVIEAQLFELFSRVAQVLSIRVCRDQTTRSSLGYAYVNFTNAQEADKAKKRLNFTLLNGKPIRIMFSQRDPSVRKSGSGNVFIKNLDASIDNKALYDTFATFGSVLSCKVVLDTSGQSKGHGFVQFDNEEDAKCAIKQLNGMLINDKQVYVGSFVRRQERAGTNVSPKFTNVYVKNLSETVNDEELTHLFVPFGTITSSTIMKDTNGKSRGFGFVNFQSPDSAATAVEKLNGTTNDGKVLFVGRAQRKAEREHELKVKFEQERISRYEKLQGANLYLKNIDDGFSDEKLKDLFSEFGTITSCRVMLDSHGNSKGSGFVAFSTREEAIKALNEMNGKLVGRKPLFVAVAQRKEERKAQLQAQFAQIRVPGGMSLLPAAEPGYHLGSPRLVPPQQLYYGQGTPGFIAPQSAGFGFQPQILSGMRPVVAPSFAMPYQLQRQRIDARRNGNLQPQQRSTSLASDLASATPENQRMMLGEHLYPLVKHLTPNQYTAKVTGMLLEMDRSEVIHLIESPDDLKQKIYEALQILHDDAASRSKVGGQLG